MKNVYITLIFLFTIIQISKAQSPDSLNNNNTAQNLVSGGTGLGIGGYGEVHFNQPLTKNVKDASVLDVHRMVVFVGYNFSKNTQFVSEIEFEYAKELWVEQAFLQHRLHKYVNLKAGLMLIPMGRINEYHEPTTFNGVERPVIDNKIAPSTWREVGVGISGNITPAFTRYQLYVVNGLSGYDTKGLFNGNQALREGRQKGSKSYMTSPNFTGRVEFYGVSNLTVGVSGYFGKSQSRLYQNLHKDSTRLEARADSSVVGISMLGADIKYNWKGVQLTTQFYYTGISNTLAYNQFTRTGNKINDLGSAMMGYYLEAGYNVFQQAENIPYELIPFVRYEGYNTHYKVESNVVKNDKYNVTQITAGLTLKLTKGAVLKTDLQFTKSAADDEYTKTLNAGIGVMF